MEAFGAKELQKETSPVNTSDDSVFKFIQTPQSSTGQDFE
jgi:hypothetical protein